MSKRTRDEAAEEGAGAGVADALRRRQDRSEDILKQVTETVRGADPADLLDKLCLRWELDSRMATVEDFVNLALRNFELPAEEDIDIDAHQEFGLRRLDETMERHEKEAIAVFNAIRQMDPAGEQPELQMRATKVIEMVYYARRTVLSAFQARLAVHHLHNSQAVLAQDLDMLLGSWALRFRWIDQTKSTPLQKLLLHLLDTAMEKRYRKHNGYVYEPIIVDGHETHAWRQVSDIKEFVYEATQKEVHWEQWSNLTASGNNAKMAIEHLSCCNDYQFRFLRKDRSVFSFRDGVYVAKEDRFYRFGDGQALSDSVVAAKYFDLPFDTYEGQEWRDIPTPNLKCIMDFQQWDPAVCDWMYIVLGRLLYTVGERDGWQIIPFLLGNAATGKSTISLKVAKLFYEHGDVGVLSNNIERQFGLSAFWDKLLFVGPEIKADLKVEQAEFQSIVSGESVQISAKHKKAFTVEWTTPGILAGNEVPAFSDNAGSVQRRFLVFSFHKSVVNGDMKLADKLALELPAILVKANRAYLDAAARWGARNVWTVLPPYFQNTRNELAQAVNSVEAFLASKEVVLESGKWCPFKEFRDAWKAYAIANGYPQHQKPKQAFRTPFDKFGLALEDGTREYRGVRKTQEWVVGLDLVGEQDEDAAAALG